MARKSISKSLGNKIKRAKLYRVHSPAPRWIDLKIFGLGKALYRSIKRFRSKHWRKNKYKKI